MTPSTKQTWARRPSCRAERRWNMPPRTWWYAHCEPTFRATGRQGMMSPWFQETSHGEERIGDCGPAAERAVAGALSAVAGQRAVAGGVLSQGQAAGNPSPGSPSRPASRFVRGGCLAVSAPAELDIVYQDAARRFAGP